MKNKLLIKLSLIAIMIVFVIGTGCELPGSNSNNDTTGSVGTGGSDNTGGTGGNHATGQMNGAWQGAYQETSINMPGPLKSGIFHFNFNQNSNTSFSGSGYFQENGMPQVPLNSFNNGILTGSNISFTVENTPMIAGSTGSDKIQFSGTLNSNAINGTFERTIVTQGKSPVIIKGNFSLQAGGTPTGPTTVNITGSWQGTYNDTIHSTGILGSGMLSFNFTQTGNSISGNGSNLTLNGHYVVTSGIVNGNNINFALTESSNDSNNQWTSNINDIGTINGNTITGTYEAITNVQNPFPHTETSKGNFILNKIN